MILMCIFTLFKYSTQSLYFVHFSIMEEQISVELLVVPLLLQAMIMMHHLMNMVSTNDYKCLIWPIVLILWYIFSSFYVGPTRNKSQNIIYKSPLFLNIVRHSKLEHCCCSYMLTKNPNQFSMYCFLSWYAFIFWL